MTISFETLVPASRCPKNIAVYAKLISVITQIFQRLFNSVSPGFQLDHPGNVPGLVLEVELTLLPMVLADLFSRKVLVANFAGYPEKVISFCA